MTDQTLAITDIIEQVVIMGDLSKLTPAQRVSYYHAVCKSVGLNPLTKPFDYIQLNGKLILYAKRDATDQLRAINKVSITKLERETMNDVYVVTAYAEDRTGRTDSSIGAVNIGGLKGDALANAMMKAETKAKRRVTLSICGLGMLDETEVETIPTAHLVEIVDTEVTVKASDVPAIVAPAEPPMQEEFPMPEDEAPPARTKRTASTAFNPVASLIEWGYAQNNFEASAILNKSPYTKSKMSEAELKSWAARYRGWRDTGLDSDDAAMKATAGVVPQ